MRLTRETFKTTIINCSRQKEFSKEFKIIKCPFPSKIRRLETEIEWTVLVNGKTFYTILLSYNGITNNKKIKVNENHLMEASISRKNFNHCFQIENIDMAVKYNKETSSFHLFAFQKDVEIFPVIKHPQYDQLVQNQQQQQQQSQYLQQSQQQFQQQQQQQPQFSSYNYSQNSMQQQQVAALGAPVYSNDRSVMGREQQQFNSSIPTLILPLSTMQSQTNQYQSPPNQQQSQYTTKEEFATYLSTQIASAQQILQVFKEVMNNCRSNQDVVESKELSNLKVAVDNNYRVLGSYTDLEIEEKQMETIFKIMDECHNATERYQKACSLQKSFPSRQTNKPNDNQSNLPMNPNTFDMAKGSYAKENMQGMAQDNYIKDQEQKINLSQDLKKTSSSSSSYMSKNSNDKVSSPFQASQNSLSFQEQVDNSNSYYSNNNNQVQDYNKPKEQQSSLFFKQSSLNKSDKDILFGDNKQVLGDADEQDKKKKEDDISLSMLEKKMNNLIALKDSQWDKKAGKEGWKEEFPDVGNKAPRKAYPNPNNLMKLPKQQAQEEEENENMQKKSELQSELLDDQLCIICYHKQSTFALVPCGHKKYCEQCAQEMVKKKVCAFCMEPVTQYMRIFS